MNARPNGLNSIPEEIVHLTPLTNAAIRQLIQDVKELRMQVAGITNRNYALTHNASRHLSFHEHAFETTNGQTSHDARSQRRSIINFLPLKNAQNMIPEIDVISRKRVKEFLNASSYAMKNIYSAEKHTLLKAIICTKFTG